MILKFNEFIKESMQLKQRFSFKGKRTISIDIFEIIHNLITSYAEDELKIRNTQEVSDYVESIWNELLVNYNMDTHKDFEDVFDADENVICSYNSSSENDPLGDGHYDETGGDFEITDIDYTSCDDVISACLTYIKSDPNVGNYIEDNIYYQLEDKCNDYFDKNGDEPDGGYPENDMSPYDY